MNEFLRFSMEGSLQNNLLGMDFSSFSSHDLSNNAPLLINNSKFQGQQTLITELHSLFKFWYQETLNQHKSGIKNSECDQFLSPALGIVLFQINKEANFSISYLRQLHEIFHFLVDYHRYLYQWKDPMNEGLISSTYHFEKEGSHEVQDPLFNTLLVWSNDCLMKIGQVLEEDLSEIIEWQELTVYSVNTKLWNESKELYEIYSLKEDKIIETPLSIGISPLMGGIPTQEQAEKMVMNCSATNFYNASLTWNKATDLKKHKNLHRCIDAKWMIQNALLRYDFTNILEKTELLFEVIEEKKQAKPSPNFNKLSNNQFTEVGHIN